MSTLVKTNSVTVRPPGNDEDRCPHCSSTRYMNKNLVIFTNTVCYHRLCETCADRLFGPGPRTCPYAGCGKTIRRGQYRRPRFEDLAIEREVDLRGQIARVFNRREAEFVDLRSWNDYLESVEELTFNLIFGIDVKETEAKIESYRIQNAKSIERNRAVQEKERETVLGELKADRIHKRLGRHESLQEEEELRQERAREEQEAQQWNRRTGDSKIASSKNVARKKATTGSKEAVVAAAAGADNGGPVFQIQGLKPIEEPKVEEEFNPFGGYVISTKYYQLQKSYQHSWLDRARKDVTITAGGYDVSEYCARAMMEAFSGLGVFIGEEVAAEG